MHRSTLAVALATTLMAATPTVAAAADSGSTLHVVGSGRVFVMPDIASIGITVNRSANDRQTARRNVDRVIARIVGGIQGVGIPRPDIQTSNVSLSVSTAGKGRKRHDVYDAETDLTVTVRQIRLLSRVFTVATHDGADGYQGPNYGFSDPSAGLIDASRAAIVDARKRANAAAAQLGMHISGIVSVDLDPQSSPLPAQSTAGSSSPSAKSAPTATLVLAGRQEVDASVDIVYQLSS